MFRKIMFLTLTVQITTVNCEIIIFTGCTSWTVKEFTINNFYYSSGVDDSNYLILFYS